MIDSRLDVAGGILTWSIQSGTELQRFQEALRANGFKDQSPERMTDGAALKAALAEEYPRKCKIVAIQKVDDDESDSFEVIRITGHDETRNEYTHVITATVRNGQIETDIDYDLQCRLQSRFRELTTLLPVAQATRCLVSIVHSLGGLTMTKAGGVYWLPIEHWQRWIDLIRDVELCNEKSTFNAFRVVLDADCIKGIGEALTAEIQKESAALEELLANPETGLRAAKNAQVKAGLLRDKIANYESTFGLVMSNLHETLDAATAVEAKATIMDCANGLRQGDLLMFAMN